MNNIYNKLITKDVLECILHKHIKSEFCIKDVELYQNAFVHKSFLIYDEMDEDEDKTCVFNEDMFFKKSNERLEFFGDSCLNLITAEYLFEKFPDKNEGFLTKLRTRLVRNTQLSYLGECLGFNEWLLISCHVERISGRSNPRLIEDVFESFLAAIYKDLGFYECKEFVYSCFDTYIDVYELANNNDNYKDIILRVFQKEKLSTPVYKTILQEGDVHNRVFHTVTVVDKSLAKDSGYLVTFQREDENIRKQFNLYNEDVNFFYVALETGKLKKQSEQNSSKKLMELLSIPFDF